MAMRKNIDKKGKKFKNICIKHYLGISFGDSVVNILLNM